MTLIPSAQADASGKFTIITDGKNGIPTGSYDVTVTWPDPSVKPTESQRMQGLAEPGPDLLAGKYGKKGASGLKVDISAASKELPAFDLKTKSALFSTSTSFSESVRQPDVVIPEN
jgi:hypothetical protein